MSKAPYPCAPTKNLSPGRGRIEPTNNGGAVSLCTHEEPVTAGDRQRSLGPSLRRPQQSPAVGWKAGRVSNPAAQLEVAARQAITGQQERLVEVGLPISRPPGLFR